MELIHDCAVCGVDVRYVDFAPPTFLCEDCGFPDPHPSVKADEAGYAYVEEADDGQ